MLVTLYNDGKEKNHMARLKDIAAKAHVSISTVSRVLNHDPSFSISLENRQKILQIAEELDYPVNTPTVVKEDLHLAGKVYLVLLYDEIEEVEDPYYLSIRTHCRKECRALGLDVEEIYYPSYTTTFPQQGNSQYVLIGSGSEWTPFLAEQVKKLKSAPILVDFMLRHQELEMDSIGIDMKDVVDKVLHYLQSLGYSRIGYIGSRNFSPSTGNYVADEREVYFHDALKHAGILEEGLFYITDETSLNSGYTLAQEALKSNLPEVFFVETDSMAIGVAKAFKERGLAIPDDIGLISCNDIPEAQYLTPALTTVKLHTHLMGVMAARLAAERLLFNRTRGVRIVIPCELIVRESCRNVSS